MKYLKIDYFIFTLLLCPVAHKTYGMEGAVPPQAAGAPQTQAGYDSDSEAESEYQYRELPSIDLSTFSGKRVVLLSRGIHFSQNFFSKQERSRMRRLDESRQPIYSSAAYDVAKVPVASSESPQAVQRAAEQIRTAIATMTPEQRNSFQQSYSNSYAGFHKKLGEKQGIFSLFISGKNPQVSTSETAVHSSKYAAGLKCLGDGVEHLDPTYDGQGRPKHPYLGKIYVMLVDITRMDELRPYFVVHGHAHNFVTICTHFSKSVLDEREVSFPGFVPGECVVLSVPLRVPSFAGEYKPWYLQKYGISKRVFDKKKNVLRSSQEVQAKAVQSLLQKYIIPHMAQLLTDHIKHECERQGVAIVYKALDDGFGQTLPVLSLARDQHRRVQEAAPQAPQP